MCIPFEPPHTAAPPKKNQSVDTRPFQAQCFTCYADPVRPPPLCVPRVSCPHLCAQVCLFGANEVSLRDAVRGGATDDELAAVISAAVDNKKAAHAGMEVLAVTQNRPMITIGG